ncbi:MAG: 6,7-dimethyl-8-ribityllumazine synthase [Ilumatobacteraceae bacterium]
MNIADGNHAGASLSVGIVCSRFNEFIVTGLLDGAKRGLRNCRVNDASIDVIWVPGAYEIPLAARTMAVSGHYDALIALGAVIRGETAHFEYVAGPCADGVARIQLETGIPIGFAVLTTENVEQAVERSGSGAGNKGEEAAIGAIEMVNVLKAIRNKK